MPDPISHAEMIAAVKRQIDRWEQYLAAFEAIRDDTHFETPIDEARAELEAQRAVLAHLERTQWRPIEEAPKDGTRILTYREGDYADVLWTGATRMRGHVNVWGNPERGWSYPEHSAPTHWMPLPPSPETPR